MSRAVLLPPLLVAICLSLLGCAATPPLSEPEDFRTRAQTQVEGGVRVSAAVLSPAETEHVFSLPLARKNIQPVWIEIDNQEDADFAVMLLSIDPEYFAPSEVAWKFRAQHEMGADQMMDMFLERQLPSIIPRGTKASGFVYTNLDPGAKAFAVELITEGEVRSFEFVQVVPGFKADFMAVDFEQLYPAGLHDLDHERLREYLEGLPCCVSGGDGQTPGDPLNLVIVGEGRHV